MGGDIQPIYGNIALKGRLWKTKMLSKLHHFLWKALSKSLATGSNLKRRHIITDDLCRKCCQDSETEKHLLFDCSYAQAIWRESGIDNRIITDPLASFEDKIAACLQVCTHTRLAHFQNLPFWILWRIWKSRNYLIFQRKQMDWRLVLQQARKDAQEWMEHNHEPMGSSQQRNNTRTRVNHWERPRRGWVKCNVDSSFINSHTSSTSGWIIRNEDGFYKGAAQGIGRRVNNSFESEVQGILMAMQHLWSKGYRFVIFESDCKKVIDTLNRRCLHFDGHNWIRDVLWWKNKFNDVEFHWTSRESNKPADKMAKQHIPLDNTFWFHYYVPEAIMLDLHNDYVNSF